MLKRPRGMSPYSPGFSGRQKTTSMIASPWLSLSLLDTVKACGISTCACTSSASALCLLPASERSGPGAEPGSPGGGLSSQGKLLFTSLPGRQVIPVAHPVWPWVFSSHPSPSLCLQAYIFEPKHETPCNPPRDPSLDSACSSLV